MKLSLPNTNPTYINSFYRPPDGNVNEFIDTLETQISQIVQSARSDQILLGDANIDLLKNSRETRSINNFLTRNNLYQVITKPTRICETSSTLIDHIYMNNPDLYAHRGTVNPGLSDHNLTFICRKRAKNSREKKTVFIRDYCRFDPITFCRDINQADWSDVYSAGTVDEAVASFNFVFIGIINSHLPLKKIRTRIKSAPWVNNEFLSLLDAREYKSNQYNKCPCQFHFEGFPESLDCHF